MNQMSVSFSKKYRRSRSPNNNKAVNRIRRPTLFGIDDLEELSAQGSRVRLLQQMTKPDNSLSRDFTAYFQGSTEHSDPAYLATSHHTRDLFQKRKTLLPTYPCAQALRWNPYVETSSYDDETDKPDLRHNMRPNLISDMRQNFTPNVRRIEEQKFNCKCESCSSKRCPSKGPVFKDNIMTFCDQQTMTPRLNEVGCGCTPISSTRVSDASVTTSDIAIKDTSACMEINNMYSSEKYPASILKNNGPSYDEYPNYSQPRVYCEHADLPPTIYCLEPERDIHHSQGQMLPTKISSIRSFLKYNNNQDCSSPRRIIYNEGISDTVANHFPVRPFRSPSPTNLKIDCSKSSVKSKCCMNEVIPFSHRNDSRYHHNCKKSTHSRSFYGDVNRHIVTNQEIVKKPYTSKPTKYKKMPKRVLTSDRDIEIFMDREYPQIPATARR